ncbi:MAG: hypothetical protein DK303_001090 [Chloroflexi bacterium]|nr:MAG: hypothetical protein DK303_001090 [Chloroflexota bacterium]
MSDRYKNEIEKILEDTPDLPDEPPEAIGPEESFYSQMISLFHMSRNRKFGSISAFSMFVFSIIFFIGFFITKVNLLTVFGISSLIVSYLTFVWPTSFKRPIILLDKFVAWCGRLFRKTGK